MKFRREKEDKEEKVMRTKDALYMFDEMCERKCECRRRIELKVLKREKQNVV